MQKLTAEEVHRLGDLFKTVTLVSADSRYADMQLPLRRLDMASRRPVLEDQLVDFTIGLERLLAADTAQLESTFRFRLRGAALLSEKFFGTVDERIELMNKLYSLRSAVVHGRATDTDVREYTPRAEEALKKVIEWYLRRPEPKAVRDVLRDIDRALVSGGNMWAKPQSRT
jgi:Apea-like HEPN